jgi:hypothetical protein
MKHVLERVVVSEPLDVSTSAPSTCANRTMDEQTGTSGNQIALS